MGQVATCCFDCGPTSKEFDKLKDDVKTLQLIQKIMTKSNESYQQYELANQRKAESLGGGATIIDELHNEVSAEIEAEEEKKEQKDKMTAAQKEQKVKEKVKEKLNDPALRDRMNTTGITELRMTQSQTVVMDMIAAEMYSDIESVFNDADGKGNKNGKLSTEEIENYLKENQIAQKLMEKCSNGDFVAKLKEDKRDEMDLKSFQDYCVMKRFQISQAGA